MIMVLSIVAIIFIVILGISGSIRKESKNLENDFEKKDMCYKLSTYLTGTLYSGNGAVAETWIDYDMTVFGDTGVIIIKDAYTDNDFFCSTPIAGVTNSINATFELSRGFIRIENSHNALVMRNA